ncbi:[FeFe] hydrogenase H-cluster radical SAM maturase HydE [Agrilactobacillus yilanensis]|uniref:[FeFe] hydrogenase H-cluster radical SAM maturase HydE n=1 Tax=Agrilactobacillus yilanensis TaxID=2485997 RepID=A0ABW4J5W7_9LACO|nr:[FeFe] hydrogenase H-cluster radical SAM maturase HydE [Agrilactobacillus yilanensis]
MVHDLIDQLYQTHHLTHAQWVTVLTDYTPDDQAYATQLAHALTIAKFGKKIFFRGIVEYTNYCRNDCLYCGIRHSNHQVKRYRLSKAEILACCEDGYQNGFRTFVLQGGEDPYYTTEIFEEIIATIHQRYPDCAITLSIGESTKAAYQRFFDAGADRFLLRHETASPALYRRWHPAYQPFEHRMQCLKELKAIGYQTGCGFMVGAPFQTIADLATDMVFTTEFQPEMIGIGPFIPHSQTPFKAYSAGNEQLTLFILSLCRILLPDVLLPATTALGTVQGNGRQLGVLAGCNVVMPNLSPLRFRKQYLLYDNKAGINDDAATGIQKLSEQMQTIGYQVVRSRGDFQPRKKEYHA